MTGSDEKTASLLAAIWQRNRALVEERLALLDRAASSAAAGGLSDELRQEACNTAHKLAGSLGMYGFDEGTRIAREMEVLLGEDAPDPVQLGDLVAALRKAILPAG
jgi:HPt (histidine-containing phosphotransfer) domain-containing protein